jgi:hypothetical protein
VLVRVHPQYLGAIHRALSGLRIDGLVVPKVTGTEDIRGILTSWPKVPLWAMIETPEGAANLWEIAGMPLKIAAKMREDAEIEYFETKVQPLLGGGVEYVGEVDEAGKFELLGAATALLNPIQWPEPFGLVMIEALACGTPVVATSAGSVPEIVDDGLTGFIRDAAEDLASCLLLAVDLDRAACREAAESRFSTARMVADHLELYTELVSEAPAGNFPERLDASPHERPSSFREETVQPALGSKTPAGTLLAGATGSSC